MSKRLYRSIELLLRQIDDSTSPEEMLRTMLKRLVERYAETYGIASGRLYRERSRDYLLIESIGEYGPAIAGKSVSKSYPIIKQIERDRLIEISPDSPGFDPALEAEFTTLDNTAILVGANPAYILSFGIHYTGNHDNLLVLLESMRTAISLKLRQSALEDQLRQVQSIQLSLLPRRLPQFEGFELAATTIPADEVGGDVYDVQRIGPDLLGFMIADASGHGLPAALQARDVVIGLRMGMAKDEKIIATIRRLNEVINKGGLTSRFISLFFGELERNGDIFYVNCGHCRPLLFKPDGRFCELLVGGPVLGPLPAAQFQRSYAKLLPGDCLVLFSDGLFERRRKDASSGPRLDPAPAPAVKPGKGRRGGKVARQDAARPVRRQAASPGREPAGRSGKQVPGPSALPLAHDQLPWRTAVESEESSAPDEFGVERIVEVCRANLGRSAKQLASILIKTVHDFGGGQPWEDDVTVMVLRRRPGKKP